MKIAQVMQNTSESLKTSRNIRKVRSMLNRCFYTKCEKLGDGAFEVRAFRPSSDYFSSSSLSSNGYSAAYKALTPEISPSCCVKYDPTKGLETTVRGMNDTYDIFYKVTQKFGEEPKIDESVLEKAPENLKEAVAKELKQIKNALGSYIPTLKSIKK
ncbi:hypothetical protein IKA15_03065 [bacterium]|nr:hypothetical protein [bacterium]